MLSKEEIFARVQSAYDFAHENPYTRYVPLHIERICNEYFPFVEIGNSQVATTPLREYGFQGDEPLFRTEDLEANGMSFRDVLYYDYGKDRIYD